MPCKQIIFFLLLARTLGAALAFRKSDRDAQSHHPEWQQLSSMLNSNPGNNLDTGGRSVNLDSAQLCINRFEAVMQNHGFSSSAGQKVNIHITRTSMITTGEVFQGKGLLEWLTNTAAQYDAAGKTLMVKIQLGIYDSAYLNTYQPNTALKSKNLNRIAIFLIPYDSAQAGQQGIRAMVAPSGTGTSGGSGYDLGGIQP
ncbi:MAG: hypothetical protein Q8939_03965 [Bacteroidota bacterium]|nr:hypothetical protein [Bacteroidota bacterium]